MFYYANRPKIKIVKTAFDSLIDCVNIILLVVYFVYVYLKYQHLPELIPTHFGATGTADDFGPKSSIWILPITGFILLIGMRVLSHYPHRLNYWVNITEENAARQYRFGIHILKLATLYVILLFFYISIAIIKTAQLGTANYFDTWFLTWIIGSSLLLFLYILIKSKLMK